MALRFYVESFCCEQKRTLKYIWRHCVFYDTFVSMNKKTTEWENVKLPKQVVNKLRSHKKKTGISIMAFTKSAILEKLQKEKLDNQ